MEHIELDKDNKEWQLAWDVIANSRRSLFVTGKAGTGKSTFLREVASNVKKKSVVLAPTGIAAINAGGATLHSFFKIPFFPLLPDDSRYTVGNIRKTLKYNNDRIKLLREVELIIIDEISMVRADIIDFVDKVLRVYNRNMREPFGGKQMMLVGDIFQLEPVVTPEERQLLQRHYASPYFFEAKVFQAFTLVSIELRKVYRQRDERFIGILDNIRNGMVTDGDLSLLNQRKNANARKDSNDVTVTLCSRRDSADYINQQRLAELPGEASVFNGEIQGDFPETALPSPMELELKPGAQVIFVKNDKEKRWVNGTIGVVSEIDLEEEQICVVDENGSEHYVKRDIWENVRYTFNEKEKKIEEQLLGTYKQYPLKLAWAITIHKSQGLTFNRVKIDLGGGAFAGGQTYVALSRCRSLEGITLNEALKRSDVFVRQEVVNFSRRYNDNRILQRSIIETQADKEYREAVSAFDAEDFQLCLDWFFKAIHSRYDIEKPSAKRLIRRKLSKITLLQQQIEQMKEEQRKQKEMLKRFAVEYIILGKECEKAKMWEAAVKNYDKALELCPDAIEATKRKNQIQKKHKTFS